MQKVQTKERFGRQKRHRTNTKQQAHITSLSVRKAPSQTCCTRGASLPIRSCVPCLARAIRELVARDVRSGVGRAGEALALVCRAVRVSLAVGAGADVGRCYSSRMLAAGTLSARLRADGILVGACTAKHDNAQQPRPAASGSHADDWAGLRCRILHPPATMRAHAQKTCAHPHAHPGMYIYTRRTSREGVPFTRHNTSEKQCCSKHPQPPYTQPSSKPDLLHTRCKPAHPLLCTLPCTCNPRARRSRCPIGCWQGRRGTRSCLPRCTCQPGSRRKCPKTPQR